MTGRSAPLRFLALAVGGWVLVRVATLVPGWRVEPGQAAPAPVAAAARAPPADAPGGPTALAANREPAARPRPAPMPSGGAGGLPPSLVRVAAAAGAARPGHQGPTRFDTPALVPPPPGAGRWSDSAWLLVRRDGGSPALAPGGTLGGGQAGARLRYRLNGDASRPLSLSARLYAPLARARAAEAAAGLDWRPLAAIPLNLLLERRQALEPEGRSAFSLAVHGGGSARLPGGLRLDGFGQAGLVGLRSRDPFADGAARLVLPLGRLEIGAGAWGAAQPGAARLDAGPHIAVRLPAAGAELRVQADWRFRLAGDAAPGSGPALTLSTGF